MRFTARTFTLLARELDQLTDRLNLLVHWFDAETEIPNALRHTGRDLIAALESVDLARMDVTDALSDETDKALDAAVDRHPAGRHRTPEADDQGADEIDPGIREIASLAALAFVADPERTRAALAGIGSTDPRDINAAPTFESTIDQLDGPVPPATPEPFTPHASLDDQGDGDDAEGDHTDDVPEAGTNALSPDEGDE